MPHPTARRRLRLARALHDMPAVADAWADGEIDSAHVAAFARAYTPVTAAAFARDEKMLLDDARRLRFDDFTRVLAYWTHRADPDGAEGDAAKVRDRRRCHFSQTFGGAFVGDQLLDAISGAIVDGTLRAIEQELFEADWAEARARLGREPTVLDLPRTPAQRRADAMVEMAIRASTAPENGRRPAPLFTVFVGYERMAGPILELANGTALTPSALVPWLTEADIERAVFDSPSRVIDVGERRRLFRGGTRRAVEIRDRNRCYEPSCTATHGVRVPQPGAEQSAVGRGRSSAGGPTVRRCSSRRSRSG